MLDAQRFEKPIRKLRKFLKRVPKRPTIDQIHDLRTNARRFESNVEALGLDSKQKERRLLSEVARIRKLDGKIREVDVLTGHLLGVHVDREQDCQVQLIEALGLRALVAQRGEGMRSALKGVLKKSLKLLEQAQQDGNPQVGDMIAARALHASNDLKSPARLDQSNLHRYRLKVKALRYVLQLSVNSEDLQFVSKLGEVKDAIGEWHNWEELY